MLLSVDKSECGKNDPIVVCEENRKKYTAINPERKFDIRKYHLDGKLITNQLCCDYVVINDTKKKAYFIELKGQDIKHAIAQVLEGERICKNDLNGYLAYYRIVAQKSKTTELNSSEYRRLLSKVGNKRLQCKSQKLEEELS